MAKGEGSGRDNGAVGWQASSGRGQGPDESATDDRLALIIDLLPDATFAIDKKWLLWISSARIDYSTPGVLMVFQVPCWPIRREDLLWAYLRLSSRCPPKVIGIGDAAVLPLLPIWMTLEALPSCNGMASL